jgi:hypothetical protein
MTRIPHPAASIAADSPAGPAPTTIKSYLCILMPPVVSVHSQSHVEMISPALLCRVVLFREAPFSQLEVFVFDIRDYVFAVLPRAAFGNVLPFCAGVLQSREPAVTP